MKKQEWRNLFGPIRVAVICLALTNTVVAQNPPQVTYRIPSVRSVIPTPVVPIQPTSHTQPWGSFAYQGPGRRASADFNGDGLLDILIAPAFGFNLPYLPIEIWLNKSDGTFYNGTTQVIDGAVPLTGGSGAPFIGDFNEDGRPDAFFNDFGIDGAPLYMPAQYQGYHQTLLLSQPNGKYKDATNQITPNLQTMSHSAGMADVNGDGHLDIVAARIGTDLFPNWNGVVLFLGDGKGNFVEHTEGLSPNIAWGPWLDMKTIAPD